MPALAHDSGSVQRDEVREKDGLVHSFCLFNLGMKPNALKPEGPGVQPGPVDMAGPRFPLFFIPGYIYISVAAVSTWGAGMSSAQSGFLHSLECKQTSTVLLIGVVTLDVPVYQESVKEWTSDMRKAPVRYPWCNFPFISDVGDLFKEKALPLVYSNTVRAYVREPAYVW